jgi:putative ABC transport system permease protein
MFLLKLIFKNAFRHKLRSWLTIVSITIAILAFGLLRTIVDATYLGVERASAKRIITRNAISMAFPLPLSYEEKIRQIRGVRLVTSFSWFGGIYKDEKNFFPNFCVEAKNLEALYPENIVPPEQVTAFLRDRKGALAGRKLANKFGWKVGDSISLKGTVYPGTWDFVIRAIYKGRDQDTDERLFFFHWQYLNERLKREAPGRADQVGSYVIGVEPDADPATVAHEIDKTFKNSIAETLTESEKAFSLQMLSMFDAIIVVIRLVSLIVIVIIIAVAANTMSMTTRERIGEFAVLKTLGFGAWRIGGIILGESLVISLIGCLFGILLTFPAGNFFHSLTSDFLPIFRIEPGTVYLDIVAALLVGTIAGILPAWRAIQIRIADGLRRIG